MPMRASCGLRRGQHPLVAPQVLELGTEVGHQSVPLLHFPRAMGTFESTIALSLAVRFKD